MSRRTKATKVRKKLNKKRRYRKPHERKGHAHKVCENGYHEWRSCSSKRQYKRRAAEIAGKNHGQYSYHCEYCGKWHLSTYKDLKNRED